VALRGRIVLRASEGAENRTIAAELGTNPGTVALWRRRFLMQRVPGLVQDAPRPGRPPAIPTSTIKAIVRTTRGRAPPDAPYWSARRLAAATGVSKTTVQRVWKAHQIQPRRPEDVPEGRSDLRFVEKVTDFVGLYLNAPERAMVFAVDEKAKGSLLPPRDRRSISAVAERSRAHEFRAFLQTIDRETTKDLDLHLLVDHLLAPATPEVGRWLVRHPRFHLHVLPSAGDGPNLIERFLEGVSKKRVRSTTFPSVARLHRAIRAHFSTPGASAQPFVWVAAGDEIRDRLGRTRLQR
jgi:transposase